MIVVISRRDMFFLSATHILRYCQLREVVMYVIEVTKHLKLSISKLNLMIL